MTVSSDSFKDRLKQAIGDRSVNSFAKECGTSEGAIRNYLKGSTTPDLTTLQKIADVSGCSLAWLASGEGDIRRGEVHDAAPGWESSENHPASRSFKESASELDLELMKGIIINAVSASNATGEDFKDLIAITKAMMTADSIINQYRAEKGLPSLSVEEIRDNHLNMLAALNEKLTEMADKKDK